MPPTSTVSPTVALRDEFKAQIRAAGIGASAEKYRVDRTTISRALDGTTEPSSRLIASVMNAHPNRSFEDLFEVR